MAFQDFDLWMKSVANHTLEIAGVHPNDLADIRWHDLFMENTDPRAAALEALENDGFPMDTLSQEDQDLL